MSTRKNPYKFLDSYTIDDKDIFFGREAEIEELYRNFYKNKLLLVYGKSGTGKSSVINCGLLSKIPSSDIYPIIVRCKNQPVSNLYTELNKHTNDKSDNISALLDAIYLTNYKPVVLIFDQFEEIFIQAKYQERQQLVKEMKNTLSNRYKPNIIIIIREEYFANLTEFENEIQEIYENKYRIEPLKRESVEEAILKPCEKCGVGIESGLPGKVLDILTINWKIELTYMQVLMDKLYKKAIEDSEEKPVLKAKYLELKEFEKLGNILSNFMDEQLSKMQDKREVAEFILKQMVTDKGTKKPVTLEFLLDILKNNGYKIDSPALQEIIDHFINVRIISDKDENNNYELRHDSLAARIFERMDVEEKSVLKVMKLLTNRLAEYNENKKALLNSDFLDYYIKPYSVKLQLTGELKEFVDKSKQAIINKKRRRIFSYIIGAAFILIGYLFFAGIKTIEFQKSFMEMRMQEVKSKNIADSAKEETNKQKLVADSISKVSKREKYRADSIFKVAKKEKNRADSISKVAKKEKYRADNESKKADSIKRKADSYAANMRDSIYILKMQLIKNLKDSVGKINQNNRQMLAPRGILK